MYGMVRDSREPSENILQARIRWLTVFTKCALELVSNIEILNGFYSAFLLVTKINLVNTNGWPIFLDLKDAGLHIPMHPNHRKYLRFHVQGKAYQFKAMCFGPTQASKVFTKIKSTEAAYLRVQNTRLVA